MDLVDEREVEFLVKEDQAVHVVLWSLPLTREAICRNVAANVVAQRNSQTEMPGCLCLPVAFDEVFPACLEDEPPVPPPGG